MGANIYPEDIEQALYRSPELAAVTSSFCLGLRSSARHRAAVSSFEVRDPITADLVDRFAREIVEELTAINADFRAAMGSTETACCRSFASTPPATGRSGATATESTDAAVPPAAT